MSFMAEQLRTKMELSHGPTKMRQFLLRSMVTISQ